MSQEPPDCPTVIQLERWRNADEGAFAALCDRLTPLLRARVRRNSCWPVLSRRYQLDDVVQELWGRSLDAMRNKFESVGRGALLGYLGTILDRQITDLARSQDAQKRGSRLERRLPTRFGAPDRGGPRRSAPSTPTSHARVQEILDLAGEELDDLQREAWELTDLHGYTSAEAGLALDITANAVRGLVNRARAKLAVRMEQAKQSRDSPPSVGPAD